LTLVSQPADRVLDALGNQTRRDILALLRESPLTVGGIASHLPISRPAVSKHLRILQEAGLVAYNASGTRNIFYLRPAGFHEARVYLDLFWDEALANFQRVAAETHRSEP
jgi:DNA-binding transcriptional ArsR family regulator